MMQSTHADRRDGRRVNRMDPATRKVHERLEQWARWTGGADGPGWPAKTILARTIEQGPMGASQAGRAVFTMPAEVAAVDAAVARLRPIERGVIHAYYKQWAPPDTIWRSCPGVSSLGQFRALLKVARARVSGFLDGAAQKDL